MPKPLKIVLLLLLIPSFMEAIYYDKFAITVPGPLSFGRLTFIIAGFLSINFLGTKTFKNPVFNGSLLVFIGCIFGGFFIPDAEFVGNFNRTSANILLLIAAAGLALLWRIEFFKKLLLVFFILNLAFWSYTVINITLLSGG